ncbi:MAG: response regulator [Desulfobacteraceae bacterium]|nr:response regulator [Desulfobacteraceae bacterium]
MKRLDMEVFANSSILILDDDEGICRILADMVASWGFRADAFRQPDAAMASIREKKYDIILLDVFINDVCGLDLIPMIDSCSKDLKVIVITGFADKDTAVRALKLGAFDLLEKPFQSELLHHSICNALTALENDREVKRLITDLEQSRSEALVHKERLENLNAQLRDTNRALSIFAQNIEREREEVEKRIALKLRNLIIPMVDKLRKDKNLSRYEGQLDLLVLQIEDLTSGFAMDSRIAAALSFTELRIASLIKNGVTTEEIARQLHISASTVRTHRKNIRRKLKINNVQYSLRNFLNSKT